MLIDTRNRHNLGHLRMTLSRASLDLKTSSAERGQSCRDRAGDARVMVVLTLEVMLTKLHSYHGLKQCFRKASR